MKAFINLLSDVRTSPVSLAHELMRQHPDTQEFFLQLAVTYFLTMAKSTIYPDDVAHIVHWCRQAMDVLDNEWRDKHRYVG